MSAKTSLSELDLICKQAQEAKIDLRRSSKAKKNDALKYAAEFLLKNKAKLIDANTIDMELASQKDLQDSFVDRLELNEKRIDSMISGLDKVINLDDPVGQTEQPHTSPSGFEVSKMRVPLGVIGIIYESRPNVTADASALCLKSGNACILRGGSEAANSNAVIEECMQDGLDKASLPKYSIQLIKNQDRKLVGEMIKREGDIDLLIPRGGKSLIKVVSDEAKIPVLKHYEGLCHVFIDKDADLKKAIEIQQQLTGSRPLGCYIGRISPNTRRIVAEEGGFLYSSDVYNDDLPYWELHGEKPLLLIPYTLDVNDMKFGTAQGFNTGEDFFNYVRSAFDTLYKEGETSPKMMSVGLHCRLIGRPGRFEGLRKFVEHIEKHERVWVTRRVDIAEHWHKVHPAEKWLDSGTVG